MFVENLIMWRLTVHCLAEMYCSNLRQCMCTQKHSMFRALWGSLTIGIASTTRLRLGKTVFDVKPLTRPFSTFEPDCHVLSQFKSLHTGVGIRHPVQG